jgi:hypothetical protein
MLILARTAPIAEGRKSTEGLSLFYTPLDRRHVKMREIAKMGRKASLPNRRSPPTAVTVTPRNITWNAIFAKSLIAKLAPISPQLILCFIAEKVLGLPKSY